MNENRRSSNLICNATYHLSSLDTPSTSINDEVKDFNVEPIICVYQQEELHKLVKKFLDICHSNNIEINDKNVAIIYRSKDFYYQLTGIKNLLENEQPWVAGKMVVKEFVKGKYLYDHGGKREGFSIIEKAFYKTRFNKSFCSQSDLDEFISRIGFVKYRKFIFHLINLLPKTDCSILEWVNKVNKIFKERRLKLFFQINQNNRDKLIGDLFNLSLETSSLGYRTGTVHTTKGETFEAVLLLLKQRGAKGKYYRTMLKQDQKTDDNEELRIVYVGMTRPRKILMVGVPTEEDKQAWEGRLEINKQNTVRS